MVILIPRLGSKIGFNNNIGIGNFVILSNATVVNPTGEQCNIVSTSISDSSAGTGIQKVRIAYFDSNWQLNEEIVTMNGITPVSTVATDIFRIESFEAFKAGSGQFAAGTITLKNLAGTNLFAQIDPTNTIFTRALHFVSPGKVANIVDITANCPSSSGVVFLIFITKDNSSNGGSLVLIPDIAFLLAANTTQISLDIPIVCDASQSIQGLQIGVAVKGLAASQIGMASFHFNEI